MAALTSGEKNTVAVVQEAGRAFEPDWTFLRLIVNSLLWIVNGYSTKIVLITETNKINFTSFFPVLSTSATVKDIDLSNLRKNKKVQLDRSPRRT